MVLKRYVLIDGKRKITSEYLAWRNIKNRCYNPKNDSYSRYGGRGIKVCERWLSSSQNFLDDMGKKPSKKYSLDRINSDGDYSPENCRWATPKMQANNRKRPTFKRNHRKPGYNTTSGHKGVHKAGDKYRAIIYLGSFDTKSDAIAEYNRIVSKLIIK